MNKLRTTITMLILMLFALGLIAACDTGGPPPVQPTNTASSRADATATTERDDEDPTPTTEQDEDPTPTSEGDDRDGWQTIRSAKGGFSIQMPGEPTESESTTPSELGELNLFNLIYEQGNSGYAVGYVEYPESIIDMDPEVLLEGAFTGARQGQDATEQEFITVQGFPAVQGEFEQPSGGYTWYTGVLVEAKLYQLIAALPSKRAGEEDVAHFRNSFRLRQTATRATPTTPRRATATSGSTNPGGWRTFESEEGEFSLLMPTAPRENTSETSTTAGDIPLTLYNFVSTQGNSEYTLVYVDYPPDAVAAVGNPRQVLRSAFGGVRGNNTVESEEEISVQGHPAFLAEFDSGSGYAWYQSVLRDNRLYQLIVISPNKAGGEENARRFIESFRITGEGGDDDGNGDDGANGGGSQGEMSGMTGLNNTVRFTITNIRHDDGRSAVLKPKPGNGYVHLNITIANTGDDEENISTFFANIVDSSGNEHDATYGPHVEEPLSLAIPAGGEARGTMAFEVPTSASDLVFVYDPPLDDNTLRLNLDR